MKSRILLLAILVFATIPLHARSQIQWEPHPIKLDEEIKDRIRFGYLAVPENRNNPDSREIYVAFTVIESLAEDTHPDPLILLPGGPGIGLNQFVNRLSGSALLQKVIENRDLILIDIRGSGFSYPRICENMATEEFRLQNTFKRGTELEILHRKAIEECAEKILESGADITAYNSVEAAHDIEALRLALGYEQWNIRGHSYGSRQGMTLMQQYPNTVRSAVLSGMSDLSRYHDRTSVYLAQSMRILFEYCKQNQDCHEAFNELESDFVRLLTRLENDPIPLPAYVQPKIGKGSFFITADMILGGLFTLLYDKKGIEIVPLLMHQLAEGNSWIARNMALSIANTFSSGSFDIFFIIFNNDGEPDPLSIFPGQRDELADLFFKYLNSGSEARLNMFWPQLRGAMQASPEVWETLDIPVLLISGELDPITPPAHGNEFSKYFTNHVHHVIPGSGHYPHSDAQIDFVPFLNDPDPLSFDIHSHMDEQPLQFVTDVTLNRGISAALARAGAGIYQRFILPGIAILLCLFGLIYFPVRFLVRKIRSKSHEGLFKTKLTMWLVSFLTLMVVVLYALAIMDALATNPYILAIGIPAQWIFIRFVIVVLALLLVVGLVSLKSIWKSKAGVKIPSVLSLIGGVGFTLFVFLTGMF
jgi:pimeloyl-ACP methyl ester carboxylesterase